MKPLTLHTSNGLSITPEETVRLYLLLETVAFYDVSDDDRKFAKDFLLKSALTYPEYANVSACKSKPTTPIRPDLRSAPVFHRKRKRK